MQKRFYSRRQKQRRQQFSVPLHLNSFPNKSWKSAMTRLRVKYIKDYLRWRAWQSDTLAVLYKKEHERCIQIVALLPSCPAVLNIRGISTISKIRHQLQRAFIEPRYRSHLQEKCKWSNATTKLIALKFVSVGLNRIGRELLATKASNEIIPTAVIRKKMKYQSNDRCCLCNRLD